MCAGWKLRGLMNLTRNDGKLNSEFATFLEQQDPKVWFKQCHGPRPLAWLCSVLVHSWQTSAHSRPVSAWHIISKFQAQLWDTISFSQQSIKCLQWHLTGLACLDYVIILESVWCQAEGTHGLSSFMTTCEIWCFCIDWKWVWETDFVARRQMEPIQTKPLKI